MEMNFSKRVREIGIFTMLLGLVANYIPVLYLWAVYGEIPSFSNIMLIWTMALAAFGISWFIQPISFYGVLGAAGSYISWLAGSAAGIRVPAITMAHTITNTEANTPEGDAIGAIALSTSVFVTVGITIIFALIGTGIMPYLPEVVKVSLNYMLPALFAAVYVSMAMKHKELASWVLVGAFFVFFVAPYLGVSVIMLTLVLVIMGGLIGFGYGKRKGERNEN